MPTKGMVRIEAPELQGRLINLCDGPLQDMTTCEVPPLSSFGEPKTTSVRDFDSVIIQATRQKAIRLHRGPQGNVPYLTLLTTFVILSLLV